MTTTLMISLWVRGPWGVVLVAGLVNLVIGINVVGDTFSDRHRPTTLTTRQNLNIIFGHRTP